MKTLAIDVETKSSTDLAKAGVYKYINDPDFDILLFAYSVDNGPVEVISLATGEQIPPHILSALTDPTITKWAFNASFERLTIGQWLHTNGWTPTPKLDPHGWKCTMIWVAALGLPRSLDHAAEALHLDDQKIGAGKDLIQHYCVPHKAKSTETPTLLDVSSMVHWNSPTAQPEKWADFIEYNRQDVVVENEIRQRIRALPLPDWVWEDYWIDQTINDHGVTLDLDLAEAAIHVDTTYRAHCIDEMKELTGLTNPNSAAKLQQWLAENGVRMPSMAKASVEDALAHTGGAPKRVLELRQETSRSSVKKYQTMITAALPDTHRAHGLLQFMGAGRTGRWAGRLIQVQNLPRNYLKDLDAARNLVKTSDTDALELLYDSVPDTLSQLIRTAFVPEDNHRFIVADYSAIEARVLAWLAGEEQTLEAFRNGEEIYCVTASMMFGVPVEKHGINGHLRDKGKVAVLACGYQGGVNAIKAMGGDRMGMTDAEMRDTVTKWRDANPNIVNFWWDVERAAQQTVATKQPHQVRALRFSIKAGALAITLPSGRDLLYPGAKIETNRFHNTGLIFNGIGLNRKQQTEETYGGKLVENITQAVARDLLAFALRTVNAQGHRIVMHVHDEIVVEAGPKVTVDEICELMSQAPTWAVGLPLEADGYDCTYYQKD